jgi:hypothetical protein
MKTSELKAVVAASTLSCAFIGSATAAEEWQQEAIAPVVNPIFFESALIQSEVRPLFAYHRMDPGFLGADVDVRVYAVQLRYAVNERLAVIATKDGYMEIDPKVQGAPTQRGWNDIAFGVKYALYRNDAEQIQITPGLTFEIPTGSDDVFQGNSDGEFNLFVSAIKGFNRFHLNANLGIRIPVDPTEKTANIRYALMADYFVHRLFIPFGTIHAVTTLTEADTVALDTEGFDVINFGSSQAGGVTQAAAGVGFRSRLHDRVDLGFAYEYGFSPGDDIFRDRFTVDLVWRF